MKSQYQEIREAINRGQNTRAEYLIQELEPSLSHKIKENWRPFGISLFKKYSLNSINESEKIYNSKLLNNLMANAIADGDENSIRAISKMYNLSKENSSSFDNSTEFSKIIYEAYEKSKFMPLKNAINNDVIYRLVSNKNKSALNDRSSDIPGKINALFKPGKSFAKGAIGGVLDIVNEIKNIGAGSTYLLGKYGGFKTVEQASEDISRKDINIFAEDEDASSILYKAGKFAPMVASIVFGSALNAGRISAVKGAEKFISLFSKELGKNILKTGTVIGVMEGAGIAAEKTAEALDFDETTTRGVKSGAKLIALKLLHKKATEPMIGEIEASGLEGKKADIVAGREDMKKRYSDLFSEFRRRTGRGKSFDDIIQTGDIPESEKASSILLEGETPKAQNVKGSIEITPEDYIPESEAGKTNKPLSTPIPSSDPDILVETDEYGLPKLMKEDGTIFTVDNVVKASPIIQEDGVVKTTETPDIEVYANLAEASLSNSIFEDTKKSVQASETGIIDRIPAKDIHTMISGIDETALDPLQLGSIARDPNNINLESISNPDTASTIAYIKDWLKKNNVDLSEHERASRDATLRQFCSMCGFDKNIVNRFLGIEGAEVFQKYLSEEEKGLISDASIDIIKKAVYDAGAAGYLKYHPKIDKFDTKNNANVKYVRAERSKLSNDFDKLIRNPDYEYAFSKISDTKEKQTTLGFDTIEGERVPRGSFYSTVMSLLSGDTDDPKFYSDLKNVRTLLSKNNPFGYQKIVSENASKKPSSLGFVGIREKLIDPIFGIMEKVRDDMLTEEELSEYLAGEKRWKEISDQKAQTLNKILSLDIEKRDSQTQKNLFKAIYNDPYIIAVAQKVIGPQDMLAYIQENRGKFAKWDNLIANGIVTDEATPFTALKTVVSLELLSGYLRAGGDRIHESFASFEENINSPKNMRLARINELWNSNDRKAFKMLVDSDKRNKRARQASKKWGFESSSIIDDVILNKRSKTQNSIIKATIKAFVPKVFKGIVTALIGDYTKEQKEQAKISLIEALTQFFSGNMLTKDAIKAKIGEISKLSPKRMKVVTKGNRGK